MKRFVAVAATAAALVLGGIVAPAAISPAPAAQAAPVYCMVWDNVTPRSGGWYRIPSSTSSAGQNCILEQGVNSQGVQALQIALNGCYGAGLTTDGAFGPATYRALLNAQRAAGTAVDGVYGPNTRQALKWPSRTTSGNCRTGASIGL